MVYGLEMAPLKIRVEELKAVVLKMLRLSRSGLSVRFFGVIFHFGSCARIRSVGRSSASRSSLFSPVMDQP